MIGPTIVGLCIAALVAPAIIDAWQRDRGQATMRAQGCAFALAILVIGVVLHALAWGTEPGAFWQLLFAIGG